jgi:hypothetical protein
LKKTRIYFKSKYDDDFFIDDFGGATIKATVCGTSANSTSGLGF